MSVTTVNRIAGVLHTNYDGLVDMSDWTTRPDDQQEGKFLSRALSALAISSLTGVDPKTAANTIVDGLDDCGIDAIHFDAKLDTLFLVQSKWVGSGNGSFDEAASLKFANGVRQLLQIEFERFNDKVRAKEAEIKDALYAGRDIRIRLVTIHTANQTMALHVSRVLETLVGELNDPVDIADHQDSSQREVYDLITAESRDPKISIDAVLNDWGVIEKPFLAYYGRVGADQILEWWNGHRNRLFSQNLRLYYPSSSVNDAISKTIREDPNSFWYFNNGITIICDKIVKGLAGHPAHKFDNFTLEGASVVNGAQTVGSIGNTLDLAQDGSGSDEAKMWVQVRLISLEKCSPDFARKITRAANLQNAVGTREFAAMDPKQHSLAIEFALDKRRYVYKSGEADPKGEEGCSIIEATRALACAHSIRLAVDAKREIGALWADTETHPYTSIFPENLNAARVWKAVQVKRITDDKVHQLRNGNAPRADLVGAHMQQIILHLVFQDPEIIALYRSNNDSDMTQAVEEKAEETFDKVARYLQSNHSADYLANLSKNHAKCEELVKCFDAVQPLGDYDDRQQELFSSI